MTNPSLSFGVSELTAALKQQRPRRAISTLPAVNSVTSMQEAASNAGSSPGMTSPFAAVAHSPHDNALADETAFEAEQSQQESRQQQHAQQPAAHAEAAGPQSSSFGSDQYANADHHQVPGLQNSDQEGTGSMQDGSVSSDQEADMQSASSGGSRQTYRRKGRPKCILM